VNALSDIELLDAYASRHSEEAFRELVARHADLIYSAAMRQLRNPHLAEEATQSAFIALAGKAGQLRRQTIVAGWLHRAVHFAALKLQRSEARRKHWEEEAATMNVTNEGPSVFQESALRQVDGALAELSSGDRDALILRFLRQQSLREVATALGTSEEAAKKRVSRALDKLRVRLARRGVVVPVTMLAAGLSQLPMTAAPAALPSTVSALTANATNTTGFLSIFAPAKVGIVAGIILLGGLTALLWPKRSTNAINAANAITNAPAAFSMKIRLASVMVNDQDTALTFYTQVLGFVKKRDFAVGGGRWLTVVSPVEPDGTELLLEPMGFAPARTFQGALYRAGIPLTAFTVDDLQAEYQRMTNLGAVFSMKPTKQGPVSVAILDDTCGNRIQLLQTPGTTNSAPPSLRIKFVSVVVPDQEKALKFYTEVLGFVKKEDAPAGGGRWITVVSKDEPNGTEVALEPLGFAAARAYYKALFDAGTPLATFTVANMEQEYQRLKKLGVNFTVTPSKAGPTTIAVFDDTCGNLIQLSQP
jgi:RNA polymerase sigma factor (sigma-70 family)